MKECGGRVQQHTLSLGPIRGEAFIHGQNSAKGNTAAQTGKSGDHLGLTIEIFKTLQETTLIPVLTQLFNKIPREGHLPEEWGHSTAIPLFKAGDPQMPENYRTIMINAILHKVMAKCCDNLLREGRYHEVATTQAGFRKGYNCADRIFVLRAIIQLMRAHRKVFHCCFVDFRKAFNTVPRTKLWNTLRQIGVPPNLIRLVQVLYQHNTVRVQVADKVTSQFTSTMGVKQGCPLSPLLFCLYIQSLQERLEQASGTYPFQLPRTPIMFLMFTDDIVLLSTRKAGLQRQLKVLHTFCQEKELQVNLQKTFTMSFGVNALNRRWKPLTYAGQPLTPQSKGRYLGMLFFTNKAFRQARKQLLEKAKARVWVIHQIMTRSYMTSTEALQRVFTACIQATALYAIEIWGTNLTPRQWKTMQQLQNDFLKLHLGLKNSTCTATVLAESGEYPVESAALVRTARFLSRVQGMGDERLPKQALQLMREAVNQQHQDGQEAEGLLQGSQGRRTKLLKNLWIQEVTDWFSKWGLPKQYPEKDEQERVRREYLKRVWLPENQTEDMRHYKQHVNQDEEHWRAKYLNQHIGRQNVIHLARFWLRNLPIKIIVSRWTLPRHRRICQLCAAN